MDQAIIGNAHQPVAQRCRLGEAAANEQRVDRRFGVGAEQAGGDQRMGIESHEPQRFTSRGAQGGERARRQGLGLGVHQDLVREGPGMAGPDAAILAGPQQYGR